MREEKGGHTTSDAKPVSFVWKRTGYGAVGYIAEDVNAILSELCREQGIAKGYDLWKLPFFIIEQLKEQQNKIDAQRETIEKQQRVLEVQDTEISGLTALYCRNHPSVGVCGH